MSVTQRAAFEAWAINLSASLGIDRPDLSINEQGFYNQDDLVAALECWKASRRQALAEAYDAMFAIKGDKATRFDAQTAIRKLSSPEGGL